MGQREGETQSPPGSLGTRNSPDRWRHLPSSAAMTHLSPEKEPEAPISLANLPKHRHCTFSSTWGSAYTTQPLNWSQLSPVGLEGADGPDRSRTQISTLKMGEQRWRSQLGNSATSTHTAGLAALSGHSTRMTKETNPHGSLCPSQPCAHASP